MNQDKKFILFLIIMTLADIGYVYTITHEFTAVQPTSIFGNAATHQTSDNKFVLDINREFVIANITNTGSMRPTMSDSVQIILIKPTIVEISIGDIISFNCTGRPLLLAHRVVKIKNGIYTTKGDNNFMEDNCHTTFDDIRWKVAGIIY